MRTSPEYARMFGTPLERDVRSLRENSPVTQPTTGVVGDSGKAVASDQHPACADRPLKRSAIRASAAAVGANTPPAIRFHVRFRDPARVGSMTEMGAQSGQHP